MSQTAKILDYMRANGSITALDAVQDLGIMRLSARIYDLSQAGYTVKKSMVNGKNRFGEDVSFARYSLDEKAV